MTLRTDVARGRDLLTCWRELAEKRLEYLTEMFDSGRWRRYYSEYVFLENIKEAKIAVETWRSLSTPDHAGHSVIHIWSAPERAMRSRIASARAEQRAAKPSDMLVEVDDPGAAHADKGSLDEVPAAPVVDMLALQRALDELPEAASDIGVPEGYRLVRNPL